MDEASHEDYECVHPSPHIPLQRRCGYNRTIYPHTLPLEHALRETVNGPWGILSNDYEEKGEAGIYKKKLFLKLLAEAFCVMRLMLLEL